MNKTVTIVVPIHNRSFILTNTLDSIYNQTYRPLEIIIIDDGSTDDSLDVANLWKIQKENIDFRINLISQNNLGAPVARNVGLNSSSGEYISFLDSDDIFHPQFIETMLVCIESYQDMDCVICNMQYVEKLPADFITYNNSSIEWKKKPLVFGREYWATPNVIYKKSKLIEAGGWRSYLKYGWQDRELCLRLQLMDFNYIKTESLLVFCRQNTVNNISKFSRSKDIRYLKGIVEASRDLSVIAVNNGRIKEAAWLVIRYFKWSYNLNRAKSKLRN